ncbi:hypothetical protein HGI30_03820 [Paenibacillus albicereus]|uniref:Collagen-like protein n=1 Tax=Paenibacillus albicereus TaxID=2726185 RepID=A0A6H2GUF0_9BACL|nr:hypothetical protein [Paenibacillus albicereus]QJC50778.1 hypothetical protein HGI30_03820 [Paenibacillus albicereus]
MRRIRIRSWTRALILLTLLLGGAAHAAAPVMAEADSGIGTGLDSYEIPDKGGEKPPSSIEVAVPDGSTGSPDYSSGDTASPGPPDPGRTGDGDVDPGDTNPGGTNPGGANPGDTNPGGANPGGANPGGANPGGANPGGANPGGANPGGTNPDGTNPDGTNPDGTNPDGTNPDGTDPGGSNPGGTNPGGTDPPGSTGPGGPQDPGSVDPDGTDDGDTNPGDTDPGGTDPGGTDPGKTDPGSTDPGGTDAGGGKPWYQSLWDNTVQFAKGAGGGLLGAAIVVGVVVGVAAIIGITFAAPVIIAALVVGAIAGGIYALVAGDSFSFIKSIGIGGMAAGFVLTLGHAGVFGAVRGGIQLIRSAGLKSALRTAGSRIASFSRSALSNLKSGFLNLVKHPVAAVKSTLTSKTFQFSAAVNMVMNMGIKMTFEGKLPTVGEVGIMAVESFAGALIFDRVGDALGAAARSPLGKRVAATVSQTFENVMVALAKPKEKLDPETAAASGFFKGFVLQSLFGGRLNRLRTEQNIGTAFSDLGGRTVDTVVPNRSRTITNVELNRIWNDTANTNNINRWDHSGNQVTQRQLDQLQGNQDALDRLQSRESSLQEAVEVGSDEAIKQGSSQLNKN